jgi:hypothetical protein
VIQKDMQRQRNVSFTINNEFCQAFVGFALFTLRGWAPSRGGAFVQTFDAKDANDQFVNCTKFIVEKECYLAQFRSFQRRRHLPAGQDDLPVRQLRLNHPGVQDGYGNRMAQLHAERLEELVHRSLGSLKKSAIIANQK